MEKDYVSFAKSVAREAGKLLRDRFGMAHKIEYKGEIDIVTESDKMSEAIIMERIAKCCPDHEVVTEESEGRKGTSEYRWIVDPLDGTTNYAHDFPVFCVSIALQRSGQAVLGVIYQPIMDELFVAQKNGGAYLNGEKIAVTEAKDLSNSLLCTGFPYDIRRNPNNNINYFNEMALRARAIRRTGSAAIDLAYVAAGRFDGFWELKLHPWDTAAGCLLVEEAGGRITDLAGDVFHLDADHILASNGLIHEEMLKVLSATDPRDRRLL